MASVRCFANRFATAVKPFRNYATLLVAEHDNTKLNAMTLNAITAASKLPNSDKLDVVVFGKGCDAVAKEAAGCAGVNRVLLAESDQLEHGMADTASDFLLSLQTKNEYGAVAGVAGSLCREILPRMAAKLDVQPVTDIIDVGEEDGVFKRPMYAGNAIATVKATDAVKVLTFRPTAFAPAESSAAPAAVEPVAAATYAEAGIEYKSVSAAESDKPQLSSAKIVVAGGRALKSSEGFTEVLEPLCDHLGAALGASRAAVDAGFVPNELQIGQTGKVVAPDLYIAVGVSGAIQHIAGMKDSKTIVAVNKDPDAPIFQLADYGLVGDLFKEVPNLLTELKK